MFILKYINIYIYIYISLFINLAIILTIFDIIHLLKTDFKKGKNLQMRQNLQNTARQLLE